ncbi:ROK family transcriptional regulator [Sphingomonas azotifigens]|uniref:ROK family transcriptional regulator n=1 Tax=Sphingomonas azotifigens TaxID=330920 RepID=UPI0009FE916B|nr:ROK family transcriptional regulator [Sphingomonas azotifigens]
MHANSADKRKAVPLSTPPRASTFPSPDWVPAISAGGRAILDLLLRSGGSSQASLSQTLDLSQPSVARLIGAFHAAGLVQLGERSPGVRGHPSVHVTLDPDFAFALGVTLVGDAVGVTVVDFAGAVRAARMVEMPDMAPARVVEQLRALQQALIDESQIDPGRIVGAGAGVSGFMSEGDPPRFNPPHQLAEWAKVDIVGTLGTALGLPVLYENDATAATIAEGLVGIGRHCGNFAYCHLTNGFGGGLVIDRRPVQGWLGNAGDFGGVMWLLADTYPSLDTLHAYVRNAGGAAEGVEAMVRSIDLATPGVAEWIEDASRSIAKLGFLLGHIVASEKVVIGGRLPPSIAAALARRIALPSTPPRNEMPFPLPAIVPTEVMGDAVGIGAAGLPLRALFFL